MTKAKNSNEKDLFGHPVKKRGDRYEKALAKLDKATFHSRAERLKFVDTILGDTWMAGNLETMFVFREPGWAYINGEFISTIMLAQAFIERIFNDFMVEKGWEREASRGAQAIIKYCRKHQLVNEFLLDKFDRLRQIRNPFVHNKPFDYPFTLGQRLTFEQVPPDQLLEKDAKEALSLMYTFLFTHL
jgi:hypothetical protein